jgi:hypothetical protein
MCLRLPLLLGRVGGIVGSWQSNAQIKSVELAAQRFGDFFGLSVILDWLLPVLN